MLEIRMHWSICSSFRQGFVGLPSICVFTKRELDGIIAEQSLCSAGRSVAPSTDAADMPRFIGSRFDAKCKFVVEVGSTDFFTIGDVNGSWNPAPAELFTRICFLTVT